MHQNIKLSFIQGITNANDWENSSSAQNRVDQVLRYASDGTMVLLHDFQGNNNTVQALPKIIEGLKNQGYQFVTVSELLDILEIDRTKTYYPW